MVVTEYKGTVEIYKTAWDSFSGILKTVDETRESMNIVRVMDEKGYATDGRRLIRIDLPGTKEGYYELGKAGKRHLLIPSDYLMSYPNVLQVIPDELHPVSIYLKYKGDPLEDMQFIHLLHREFRTPFSMAYLEPLKQMGEFQACYSRRHKSMLVFRATQILYQVMGGSSDTNSLLDPGFEEGSVSWN